MSDLLPPSGLRTVTSGDVRRAATTLAEAFTDDPVKLFLTGGREMPVSAGAAFFNAFLSIAQRHDMTFATPGYEAVAVWAPPGGWKVPLSQVLRRSPTFLRLYGRRTLRNLLVLGDLERRHPTEPHYYLEFIGTAPAEQGRGHGTRLIAPIADRADAEGVGMYLESSKESNVGYYARFGFEVRDVMDHRSNGPQQWLMWRDPR